jgi:bifunctional DNA-binding transcriptional regulator/antitoxin component of YhaV-PrlF toxin-antitoxin module
MGIVEQSSMGNKGEILPKKSLRELAGIKPGDKILIEAREGEIIVRKILSFRELMSLPKISSGTPGSIEKELEEEGRAQEERTD